MTISYARSTVGDVAQEELDCGNLHPKSWSEKIRFDLGHWFKALPHWRHELTVDDRHIVTYYTETKAEITQDELMHLLKARALKYVSDNSSEQLRAMQWCIREWNVRAFDLRNYYRYGLTVGTVVEVDDPNYFGGQKVCGEVIEIDYDNEVLPIMTQFEGWPYLFFDAKELKVISQPSFVPLMALSLEHAN